VVLAGGRPVTVTATKRKDPASPKILAAIRQVAERYQIPAHLTGTARTLEGLPANPRRLPGVGEPAASHAMIRVEARFLSLASRS